MKNPIPVFLGIALLIIALWLGTLWVVTTVLPNWPQRGQFGDSFGSINALFGGIALAGIIVTILLQHHELKLQREELKLQREEMAKSRAELAEQARVQRLNLYATIAHLKALALEAEIRAIEMEAEQKTPGFRNDYIAQIQSAANLMKENIRELEERVEEV